MSPSHIFEPTYRAIKQILMAGTLASGFRLDTAKLARHLGVSSSPVRDSLNRLAGEGMVDFVSGEGFRVPKLDAFRLENLLDLNHTLLLSAVGATPALFPGIVAIAGSPAEQAANLFHTLSLLSGNEEFTKVIDSLGERLWGARMLDSQILTDPDVTLDQLQIAMGQGADRSTIAQLLTTYHQERRAESGAYARLLAESRNPNPFPPANSHER